MSTILIDATTAQHARGGIGVVTNGLLSALAGQQFGHQITVAAGPSTPVPAPLHAWRPPLVARSQGRILFQRIALPALLGPSDRQPDRVLYLDSYVPLWRWPGSTAATAAFVHDVLPLTHPSYFGSRKDIWKRLGFRAIARQAPEVVTSCEFTAAEIQRELGLPSRVVRFGCGQISDAQAERFLAEAPPRRRRYVLYVGAIEARKDLRTLVHAVLRTDHPGGEDLTLVIVGNWRTEEGRAFRRWAQAVAPGRVRFLGRRDSPETLTLLRSAGALVYPSVAEGFGLPVLEGLAAGTPVVAANIPVIRSWAGDTAHYFQPGDAVSLGEAIEEALSPAAEWKAVRGLALSETYRWSGFARGLLAA
ncbi:MAG: glycosyltransferase family 4 protein [Chloroflexi bacterium]|nr:glycosyltransferase family 4 protein [Chloroflexota bacterium]